MKTLLSRLHAGLLASEEALSKLDAEHQLLQQNSEETTSSLIHRVDDLQRTVAELQAESRALQSQLVVVQADAALKDAAMQQVAQLEMGMAALRERARELLRDLERDKASAERRAEALASDLSATQRRLAREAEARACSDTEAARLAAERQLLGSALALERLINEPLRRTHYATTTTLTHLMRSPAAATVRDRAGRPHPSGSASQEYIAPRDFHAALFPGFPDTDRPGSPPPAAWPGPAGAPVTSANANASARDSVASFTFSPQFTAAAAAALASVPAGPLPGQAISGRTLTRLGRSWATTTATAGLPNPVFMDNLHSPLSPPPPGPPRMGRPATATASSVTASPHPPSPHTAAGAHRTRSGGGGGGSGVPTTPTQVSGGGGAPSGPAPFLTSMRSPMTPYVEDSTGGRTAGRGPDTEFRSPVSPLAAAPEAMTRPDRSAGFNWGLTATEAASRGGRGPAVATGREAMRASIGKSGGGGSWEAEAQLPAGTPATLVYG